MFEWVLVGWSLGLRKLVRSAVGAEGDSTEGASGGVSELVTDTEISPRRLSLTSICKLRLKHTLSVELYLCQTELGGLYTKAFFAGENAGAAAAGRPACVFQVADQQRLSLRCFAPSRAFLHEIFNPTALVSTVRGHYLPFVVTFTEQCGFLTTVAGTEKHGRSAESPNAARRAPVQSVPLEGYGDSRGCSVETSEASGREIHATTAFVAFHYQGSLGYIQ
ncbi:Hypothetical predicted protein [Xyrichtys novacula]|uniref:Uncharacterized protein n=1 Tax=Xyrichtys novacula TaxID=13765 RepID=A0AAV1GBA0_XYRNO|nr:Hypothetical predicted protein [Xyrichtys novacula]